LITSVKQLRIRGVLSMETKRPKLMRSRAEAVIAALAVVVSIAAGSAVLAQDFSAQPSTPPVVDKPPVADKIRMGAGGGDMMGMGADGNGMMGMMSGMKKMGCCGQGMGHADHGAMEK
jgi:hypothetical protein